MLQRALREQAREVKKVTPKLCGTLLWKSAYEAAALIWSDCKPSLTSVWLVLTLFWPNWWFRYSKAQPELCSLAGYLKLIPVANLTILLEHNLVSLSNWSAGTRRKSFSKLEYSLSCAVAQMWVTNFDHRHTYSHICSPNFDCRLIFFLCALILFFYQFPVITCWTQI